MRCPDNEKTVDRPSAFAACGADVRGGEIRVSRRFRPGLPPRASRTVAIDRLLLSARAARLHVALHVGERHAAAAARVDLPEMVRDVAEPAARACASVIEPVFCVSAALNCRASLRTTCACSAAPVVCVPAVGRRAAGGTYGSPSCACRARAGAAASLACANAAADSATPAAASAAAMTMKRFCMSGSSLE